MERGWTKNTCANHVVSNSGTTFQDVYWQGGVPEAPIKTLGRMHSSPKWLRLKPFWLELGYEIACFCHSNSRLDDWFNHGTGQVVLLHCVLYPPCTEYWKWDGHTLPVEGSLFPGQRWRDPAETNSLSLWRLANAWWTAAYAFCRWTGAQGPDGRDCNPKARDLDPDEWEGYQRIGMQDARSGHRSADGGPGSNTAASCGRSDPGPTASPYRTSIGPYAITDSFHADMTQAHSSLLLRQEPVRQTLHRPLGAQSLHVVRRLLTTVPPFLGQSRRKRVDVLERLSFWQGWLLETRYVQVMPAFNCKIKLCSLYFGVWLLKAIPLFFDFIEFPSAPFDACYPFYWEVVHFSLASQFLGQGDLTAMERERDA